MRTVRVRPAVVTRAGDWSPVGAARACGYARAMVRTTTQDGLTVDPAEAAGPHRMLAGCP